MVEGDPHGEIVSPKRPGGPLSARPYSVEGQWYDGYGKHLVTDDLRDAAFAEQFWRSAPPNLRAQMVENIHDAADKHGFIGVFTEAQFGEEMEDRRKYQMSAYRQLARELGYEYAQWIKTKSGTVLMQLGKQS